MVCQLCQKASSHDTFSAYLKETPKTKNINNSTERFSLLLEAILNDPVVNSKVTRLLKMDSYARRIVLSNWLEQLRRKNAPGELLQTLSILFDNKNAEMIYNMINNSKLEK